MMAMANRNSMGIDVRRYAIIVAFIFLSTILLLTACGSKRQVAGVRKAPPAPKDEKLAYAKVEKRESKGVQYGVASWYGPDFHGKPTSSGEIYDMYQLTCAHNTLPLGTVVIVTNLENGKSLELKVNDRGPFAKDRIIDLSYAAASILGVYEKGTAWVKVETIGPWIEEVQRLTLQVASFTDENNAQRLAEQLRRDFDQVYVATVETSTQKYHRVRVGQFEERDSALRTAERLSQMGFSVLVTTR
jgi:rare lipoprotein A